MKIIPSKSAGLSRGTKLFLFDRFFRVVASNVNSLLKKMEDPEKLIEQAVLDMQNDLVRIRQSYAEISATQKRMENQKKQALAGAEEWFSRAKFAVDKGEDELAKEALQMKNQQLEIAENLQKQLDTQKDVLEKLFSSIQRLEMKISEAKRQKDSFIARAKTAKTSIEVNDMLSSISGKSSMESFERMKEKVETLEVQAEVTAQISSSTENSSLEAKFRKLEGNLEVDRELEALKSKPSLLIPEISELSNIDWELSNLKEENRSRQK